MINTNSFLMFGIGLFTASLLVGCSGETTQTKDQARDTKTVAVDNVSQVPVGWKTYNVANSEIIISAPEDLLYRENIIYNPGTKEVNFIALNFNRATDDGVNSQYMYAAYQIYEDAPEGLSQLIYSGITSDTLEKKIINGKEAASGASMFNPNSFDTKVFTGKGIFTFSLYTRDADSVALSQEILNTVKFK